VASYERERALDGIEDLARRGHDLVTFWRETAETRSEGDTPRHEPEGVGDQEAARRS
jgi:hypothetical protein